MTALDRPVAHGSPPNRDLPTPQRCDVAIGTPDQIPAVLAGLRARLDAARPTNIGFPSTLDLDITPLLPLFNQLLNNVGDPDQAAVFPAHTKDLEREVVDIIATLLRAPRDDRWGYVTTGGSEGVEYGLLLARTLYPDAVTYASTTAHPIDRTTPGDPCVSGPPARTLPVRITRLRRRVA